MDHLPFPIIDLKPRSIATKWRDLKIKMGPPKSILKKASNKRLIFTDGKQRVQAPLAWMTEGIPKKKSHTRLTNRKENLSREKRSKGINLSKISK